MRSQDVARLVSGDNDGLPVLGLPTSGDRVTWTDDDRVLFDLFVGVPRDRPTQVWRLVIDLTDSPYFGTGFRLNRVHPVEPMANSVSGWMGLDHESVGVALACDHRTSPHRACVLDLSAAGLEGMPELVEMINEEEDELPVEDVKAYFDARLAPLAVALVETFLDGGAEEPAKVPPSSLLPPGDEWQPQPPRDLVPMFHDVVEAEYQEWMDFDTEAEDHGTFSAHGWGDIPGMDTVCVGWAAWPDGTVLAISRDDNYGLYPPVINRVALPGFDKPTPENPDWHLAFKRGLVFASSWLPQEWPPAD